MTTDINSDGLLAVYEALQASPEGNIAVKLSTGEPGSNYLRTDLIGDLVQSFDDPTIVECNTAYGGSRANTAMHYQVAEDHGYTEIANVDIMDEDGSMTLPVTGGTNLEENYVGSHFENYDYYVVLSHFKGHSMAGYGGAIKNNTAAPSRIFPSALPPRKGKPIFTAAVPAAVCGAVTVRFLSAFLGGQGYRSESCHAVPEEPGQEHPCYRSMVPCGSSAFRTVPEICALGCFCRTFRRTGGL